MKKNKKQKRMKKLHTEAKKKIAYDIAMAEISIDSKKIRKVFPNKQKRLLYVASLIELMR